MRPRRTMMSGYRRYGHTILVTEHLGEVMAHLEIMRAPAALEAGYHAPSCSSEGGTRSVLLRPEGFSLWQVNAELSAGAEIRWGATHGEEALHVIHGRLEVGGRSCGPLGSVIVEAGIPVVLRAVTGTKLVHFGPVEVEAPTGGLLGAPAAAGRGVHVLDRAASRILHFERSDADATMLSFADSTCPTCRITFFRIDGIGASISKSHLHSEDEIIHVLTGELQLGRSTVSAGMSVAIPGNHRYGFRTPDSFSFLNYRRDASQKTGAPGSAPLLETIEATIELAEQRGTRITAVTAG